MQDINQIKNEILYHVHSLDESIPGIIMSSVQRSLHEDDEYRSWEIFEGARSWISEDHVTFDADKYLIEVGKLRDIAKTSRLNVVVQEIDECLRLFGTYPDLLVVVLKDLRRQHTYDGLRQNYMHN